MIEFFAHNLKVSPFIAVSKPCPQVFNDVLVIGDVGEVEFT